MTKFNPNERTWDTHAINHTLKAIIKGYALEQKITEVDIQQSWETIMGSGVAKYTLSVELKKNTLWVRLSSPALRQELSYGKEKIVQLINQHIGKDLVKEVSLI